MSKENGHSKKKTDWITGEEYIEHYDANGNKTGTSKQEDNFWTGEQYTQHYDKSGKKSGKSKQEDDFWTGEQYTQHYDKSGEKSGKSKQEDDFWTGGQYTQHYDKSGKKSGKSKRKDDFWTGEVRTVHEGSNKGNTYNPPPATSYSSSYSSGSYGSSSADSGEWLWWLVKWGFIVTTVLTLVMYALVIGALALPLIGLVLYLAKYKRKYTWLFVSFGIATLYLIDIWSATGLFQYFLAGEFYRYEHSLFFCYLALSGTSLFFISKFKLIPYLINNRNISFKNTRQENLIVIAFIFLFYSLIGFLKLSAGSTY